MYLSDRQRLRIQFDGSFSKDRRQFFELLSSLPRRISLRICVRYRSSSNFFLVLRVLFHDNDVFGDPISEQFLRFFSSVVIKNMHSQYDQPLHFWYVPILKDRTATVTDGSFERKTGLDPTGTTDRASRYVVK